MAQKNLKDAMTFAVPRETGGALAIGRFGFQGNIAILKILELLRENQKFSMIFELFDDIMVVDSLEEPTQTWLYQVKSRETGDWRISDVCATEGASPPSSIASRLFDHLNLFGEAVAETGMITNAAFVLPLPGGGMSSGAHSLVRGSDLAESGKQTLLRAVQRDYPGVSIDSWLRLLTLTRTSLNVAKQRDAVVGHLQVYCESLNPIVGLRTGVLYDVLHASIVEKAGIRDPSAKVIDLARRKSLSHEELSALIGRAISREHGIISDWLTVETDATSEGVSPADRVRLKSNVVRYVAARAAGDVWATDLSAALAPWSNQNRVTLKAARSLVEMARVAASEVVLDQSLGDRLIVAAALVEIYEVICD